MPESRILVIDNYDSFTYNLVHIIRALGYSMDVFRNDKIDVSAVGHYDKILLSPGPGIPDEAGIMKEVVSVYGPSKSILGVCLGHQGIAEVYGATLFNIPTVLHGVTSTGSVKDRGEYLFKNVSDNFQATHYHSWAVLPDSIPGHLRVTAVNNEGLLMGLTHAEYDVKGLQFHAPSLLRQRGEGSGIGSGRLLPPG
jgi:anthranilate synthase component 2